jgi:peroxiredoxin/mono/diheme cytochrome c family protein
MPRLRLAIVLAVLAAPAGAAEPAVAIGARVPNLTFKDIRYLTRSLDDFKSAKAFVLVFTDCGCPIAQRYLPTLQKLHVDYRDRDVAVLAVNVGADDPITAIAAQAVRHGCEFPFVKDFDAACARAVGVTHTPGAVVLDADRKLRYRGRIDDQYRPGGARAEPTRQDLREALEAVLAGKEVAVPGTPVDGCPITRPAPPQKTGLTFAKDVAPLLKKHCQGCHRPGTAAPFSLQTYQQVAGRAKAIAEVITDGRMPPWHAAPEYEFTNRRALPADDRDTLLAWLRSDGPRGDDAALPAPLPPAGPWRIGEPDSVISTKAFDLPAAGDVPYQYAVLPTIFLADTWVQGVEIKPDNPRVLHHCNMAHFRPGEKFSAGNFITGQVPGGEAMALPDGVAYKIPAGSVLGLQIHFVTTGKPETCKVEVGLRYARGTVTKQLRHILLVNTKYAIPPEAAAHPVSASQTLPVDALGVGLFAHMHLRGKDMTFRATYPDGTDETLLLVANYSFDWQQPYRWPAGKRLPKGTRLECVAHYDNSPFNPFNPNPRAEVRDGPQTYHEMMNGFVFYVAADEDLKLVIDPATGRVRK